MDARECEAEARALLGESECREQVLESENNNLREAAQETLEELDRADRKITELQEKLMAQKDLGLDAPDTVKLLSHRIKYLEAQCEEMPAIKMLYEAAETKLAKQQLEIRQLQSEITQLRRMQDVTNGIGRMRVSAASSTRPGDEVRRA